MRIGIIGAGRVAGHLARALARSGQALTWVYARRLEAAQALAEDLGAAYTSALQALPPQAADLWILALSDDALAPVAAELTGLWAEARPWLVHTSGSVPSTVLAGFERYGVFYPLQSFSAAHQPDWAQVPFCLYSSQEGDLCQLEGLAQALGSPYYRVDDAQRANLHLAAVWANNFANFAWLVAEQLCQESRLDFELLKPLIRESLRKIAHHSPAAMQTGPARRGDAQVLARHQAALEGQHPDWAKVYQALSEAIQAFYRG